ncbi:hypothetical protein FSP39_007760 [Pinctada imbricata]|uniref:Alpha-macroglobulin-like TED domain-containing protein n=1 Tax=Pinctada imbricata TaxID=66713 RepID=A0AA88Y722_PINIB|nr:hypothetical protein FSP39_007760 [Pinctada imbricata]
MTVRIEEYGEQIIQFVARNPADYQTTLDVVNKTLIVKPPGITNDYNIPSLISLTNEEVNKEMNLTLPDDAIAGTKQVYATVTGNIMAPTINGLDNLIRPPYGCGEQNMVTFAPTVYVMQYLIITNQFTYSLINKGHEMINRGMAKQLEFRRPDEGSFAIWGAYSEKGSTWLTSFVLRTFHHANKFAAANVDLNIIQEAITWLVNQQQSDGSFNIDDTVENYVMMGGVRDSKVTMTSYVLLSLLDNQNVVGCEEIVKEAIKNSVNYIVSNKDSLSKNQFGLAIAAYALVKCNRTEEANELYQLLVKGSVKEGGMLRWNEKCNSLCDSIEASWKSPNPRAQPIEIETASYALLYLSETGKIEDGMKITKWLTSQRNPTGGYSTSQDTVVSIEALSKFSVLVDSGVYNADLEISFSGQKGSVKINNQNTFLLQKIKVVVKYNVHAENMDTAFNINTTVEGATQTFDRISVQTCVS